MKTRRHVIVVGMCALPGVGPKCSEKGEGRVQLGCNDDIEGVKVESDMAVVLCLVRWAVSTAMLCLTSGQV